MDCLLDTIAGTIKQGQRSEKNGLYYFAGLKYSQAKGMLDSIVILHDSKEMRLSEKEEYRLSALHGQIGKHQMPGSASKDSLKEALLDFLKS